MVLKIHCWNSESSYQFFRRKCCCCSTEEILSCSHLRMGKGKELTLDTAVKHIFSNFILTKSFLLIISADECSSPIRLSSICTLFICHFKSVRSFLITTQHLSSFSSFLRFPTNCILSPNQFITLEGRIGVATMKTCLVSSLGGGE